MQRTEAFYWKMQMRTVARLLLLICTEFKTLLCLVVRYSAEEIEEKVNSFRMMLQEKQEPAPTSNERPT